MTHKIPPSEKTVELRTIFIDIIVKKPHQREKAADVLECLSCHLMRCCNNKSNKIINLHPNFDRIILSLH